VCDELKRTVLLAGGMIEILNSVSIRPDSPYPFCIF